VNFTHLYRLLLTLFLSFCILNISVGGWSTNISAFEEINEESNNLAEEEDAAESCEHQILYSKAIQNFNFSSDKAIEKEILFRTENFLEVHSPPPELS